MGDKEMILDQEIENLTIKAYNDNAKAKELFVVLEGAIDTYNSQLFEEILNKLIKTGYCHFVFSCSKLNYISSMGIGVFVNLLATLKKTDGTIVFSEVQDSVFHVFDNLGFVNFFVFKKS